jgi:hypothetical protein
MRRVLAAAAILSSVGWVQGPAWAEPPTHDVSITKNNTLTLPPPSDCPANGAASTDLVFSEQLHLQFTATTFHLTDTSTGTFTSRAAGGEVLGTGHFVATTNAQGPGYPTQTFTNHIIGTGKTTDGSIVTVHVLEHFTVTPNGDMVTTFERIDC